jgi:UDP-2,3-diacylglucosamine hydrolase
VSRALHDPAPDPAVVRRLRDRARTLLDERRFDSVVRGHSHEPVLHRWGEGVYVNTGNWYERRTFARLENGRLHLARWNGRRALDIESAEL